MNKRMLSIIGILVLPLFVFMGFAAQLAQGVNEFYFKRLT